MKTIIDKQRDYLLKKFHILCGQAGLQSYEKAALVGGYGKTTSADLTVQDLLDVVDKLEKQLNPDLVDMDVWRKRVIAAIGGFLNLLKRSQNINEIKAIACRATEYESFNRIPKQRLINIYYAFVAKQKDMKAATRVAESEIDIMTILN